ncbi:MAG: ATP-dependent DNA helicase RecG [Hyphomonadaceae bacterium]|nr:MAG: ATP-dependent DNA helicase RecG [Hyphomonadaceae bacterium]
MRPTSLNPWFQSISNLQGIGPKTHDLFVRAVGGELVRDAALHLPSNLIDRRGFATIMEAQEGVTTNFKVMVESHQPAFGNRPYRVQVSDESGFMTLAFFHPNPKYLKAKLPIGAPRVVSGIVHERFGERQMIHPSRILSPDDEELKIEFEAIYPNVGGLAQKTLGKACKQAAVLASGIKDWIDEPLRKRENWPSFYDALIAAHNPKAIDDISPLSKSRQRLAYDELFARQLALILSNAARILAPAKALTGEGALTQKLLAKLPFKPTGAQIHAFGEIGNDMEKTRAMMRLLQGDVGSGKTLVAAWGVAKAVEAGVQCAFMAPTEILARQHFANLQPLLASIDVKMEILTGRDKGKIRAQKLESLKTGDTKVLVGTHAVFQDGVEFNELGFVVIDEQHRFGVAARKRLFDKGNMPHVLTMSATPIPRTLSMAIYGDMDMSILDEKPMGRKPIETRTFDIGRLQEIEDAVARAIKQNSQIYWVCPLVEEIETNEKSAAVERFEQLRIRFGDKVALVHGKMKAADKDEAMEKFITGQAKILVATTVIEVGVDVKTANIMVIEHAEQFGLAQLHQLRGRVGRGETQSHCLLLYQSPLSENGRKRIEALRETDDGFKIAEIDYELRGGGDLLGLRQSGIPNLKIADINAHKDLLPIARKDARLLIETDPNLTSERGQNVRQALYIFDANLGLSGD